MPSVLWSGVLGLGVAAVVTVLGGWRGFHHVPESHVGIYWRLGILTDRMTEPGFHYHLPILGSRYAQIPLSFQTTVVTDVLCGTAGGVEVSFSRVEIVWRLQRGDILETVRKYGLDFRKTWIDNTVPAFMNEICSKHQLADIYIRKFDQMDDMLSGMLQKYLHEWVPGIEIITLRLTKPTIPMSIHEYYLQVTETRSRLPVLHQQQANELKAQETERKHAVIAAQRAVAVAEITAKQMIANATARLQIEEMAAQMEYQRRREQVDSALYRVLKEAESNERKLSPRYLQLLEAKHALQNTEIVYGNAIPSVIVDGDNALRDPNRGLPKP